MGTTHIPGGDNSSRPTVMRPTKQVLVVVDLLEELLGAFLEAGGRPRFEGKWSSHDEAKSLTYLLTRNVEAVMELGRRDLVLISPATSCARVAFEVSTRLTWLLYPEDPYEREARWLSLLAEEEAYHRYFDQVTDPKASKNGIADDLRKFIEAVQDKLPEGVTVPKRIPKLKEMLDEQGRGENYLGYRISSQYVHGTAVTGRHYRKNLGTAVRFGEFTTAMDWMTPLDLCWFSIGVASDLYLKRLGVGCLRFRPELLTDYKDALAQLG
ncbi:MULTISPECIES: hypothetical protein [unclassified Frankia]|uniref:hypothetical protein n=1 Tax=unclassified Frankia TaxID=2632575 RepID=UPI002AD22A2B|nr:MULTISPECIES: hypothetical protein [unclassified Frankia]